MVFLLWDYLRERTRDAVLAGFEDALDIIEGEAAGNSLRESAARLDLRLGRQANPIDGTPQAVAVPATPSTNASVESTSLLISSTSVQKSVTKTIQSPVETSSYDDEMQGRLERAAVAEPRRADQGVGLTNRRPRGRPRKGENRE
jgi:hypothetical protein